MNPYEAPQENDSPIPKSETTNSSLYQHLRTDAAILSIVFAAILDNITIASSGYNYIPILRAATVLSAFASILLIINFKNGRLLKRIFYGVLILICISIAADTFRRGAW